MTNNIKEAIKDIKKFNPVFGRFFDRDETLLEYAKTLPQAPTNKTFLKRQEVYRNLIAQKISDVFGQDQQFKMPSQEKSLVISTADHHSILNFPLSVATDFLTGYHALFEKDKEADILTLATGNVPLNNVVSKRGVDFAQRHINIFPRNEHNRLVLDQPGIKLSLFESAQSKENKEALRVKGQKEYSKEELKFFKQLDKDIFQKFGDNHDFGDQCTIWNHHLWNLFFEPSLRNNLLRLFSVQAEDIDSAFLIDIIENHQDSFIYQIFFDKDIRDKALQAFDECYGAWQLKDKKGSIFFLTTDERGRRMGFWLQDNKLISTDKKIEIDFEPNVIKEKLQRQEIFPSIITTFLVAAFWAGIKCLGGFNQVRYTTDYKEKLIKLLEEIKHPDADLVKKTDTNGNNALSVVFDTAQDKFSGFYALDLVNRGGLSKEYFERLNQVPIKYLFLPEIELFYKVSIPEKERQDINFTKDDLLGPLIESFSKN